MPLQKPVGMDKSTGKAKTLPTQKRYRCKLDSIQDVRHEMSKVYRESRSGLIDTQAAAKLVWMLCSISKIIEASNLEARIDVTQFTEAEIDYTLKTGKIPSRFCH